MNRKLVAFLQTIILIASLVVNMHPTLLFAANGATNTALPAEQAAAETIEQPREEAASSAEETPLSSPVPHAAAEISQPSDPLPLLPVRSPLGVGRDDCIRVNIIAFRPDPPNTPDPSIFPVTRPSQEFDIGYGWDYYRTLGGMTVLPRPDDTDAPPYGPDPTQAEMNLDPPGGESVPTWNAFPTTRPDNGNTPAPNDGYRFSQYPDPGNTRTGNELRIFDVRMDPDANYMALRGETLTAMIHIRNVSYLQTGTPPPNTECNMGTPVLPAVGSPAITTDLEGNPLGSNAIAAGIGQPLIFLGTSFQIRDRAGNVYNLDGTPGGGSITLSPSDFVNTYTGLTFSNPANAILERSPDANPGLPSLTFQRNRFFNDYIAVVNFTVPPEAVDFLELVVPSNATSFKCTINVGNCNTALTFNDADASYYAMKLGGVWLYKDGEQNPYDPTGTKPNLDSDPAVPDYAPEQYVGLDPFTSVHVVGPGPFGVGDTIWVVIEVKNKWGSGTDSRSIEWIDNKAGSPLTACDRDSDPGSKQGWYSTLFISPNPDIVSGGPQLGTSVRFNYGSLPIGNFQGGEDDARFCVIRGTIGGDIPVVGMNANVSGTLLVKGYDEGGTGGVGATLEVPISYSFPVFPASLQITKTIVAPVTNGVPDLVRPGDIVRYQVEFKNTGQVNLDNLAFLDSLYGPYTVTPTNTTLGPNQTYTVQYTYTVKDTDPNPIFNTVTGTAKVQGTSIVVTATDSASILQAAPEMELTLTATGNHTATPGIVAGLDTVVTYSLTYKNNSSVGFKKIEFVKINEADPTVPVPPTNLYPRLKDDVTLLTPPPNAPDGSIYRALPRYPEVEVYSDNPPDTTLPSTLIYGSNSLPFPPGAVFPAITWDYTLPVPPDPGFIGPLFQEVILKVTRDDATSSTFFASATLVTQIENQNLSVKAVPWDTLLNAPRTDLWDTVNDKPKPNATVIRGETLTFDLTGVFTLPNGQTRCETYFRLYTLNPTTGVRTLVNPDIQMAWQNPAQPNTIVGTGGSVTLNAGGNPNLRPTFRVDDTAPDPLRLLFEFDTTNGGGCSPPEPLYIANFLLEYDISNVNISTSINVLKGGTPVGASNPALLPRIGIPEPLTLSFAALNRGPLNVEIADWRYCIIGSPRPPIVAGIEGENCNDGGISMYGDPDGLPPNYTDDFGVAPGTQLGDGGSRIFLTNQPRTDRKDFQLEIIGGNNYPNPLTIQVILTVSESGEAADIVTIRAFYTLPLLQDDLNLELDNNGRTDLVRGDHNVPISFSMLFDAVNDLLLPTNSFELRDVRVLDMTSVDVDPGGFTITDPSPPFQSPPIPDAPGAGLGPYEKCTFASTTSGTLQDTNTRIDVMADGGSAVGTCFFDLVDSVPPTNPITVMITAVADLYDISGAPTFVRSVYDFKILEFNILPHLTVEKLGSGSVLSSDPVQYIVTVRNNSEFQWVDFNDDTAFTDVITPNPFGVPDGASDSRYCLVSGGTIAPAEACPSGAVANDQIKAHHFGNLTLQSGAYRLAPLSTASLSYQLTPPVSGTHSFTEYTNNATLTGERAYDTTQTNEAGEILVSASDDHKVGVQCPIEWTLLVEPRGMMEQPPGSGNFVNAGSDYFFTAGEEVKVTLQVRNLSNATAVFTSLSDARYDAEIAADPSSNAGPFSSLITWPGPPNELPPFDPITGSAPAASYSYYIRIKPNDFRDGANFLGDTVLRWEVNFTLQNTPSGAPAGCFAGPKTFEFPILHPVRPIKVIDSSSGPPFAFTAGTPVQYVVNAFNISETTDFSVVQFFDDLLPHRNPPPGGSRLEMLYCNDPSNCSNPANLSEAVAGTLYRYPRYGITPSPSTSILEILASAALRPAVDLEGSGPDTDGKLPLYTYDPADLAVPTDETLINTVTVNHFAIGATSDLTWMTAPVYSTIEMRGFVLEELLIKNPINITETVVEPVSGFVTTPGEVKYLVTISNSSLDHSATDLVLSEGTASNIFRDVPYCSEFSPPPNLQQTPYVCLPDDLAGTLGTGYFSLDPGESVSVLIIYPVTAASPDSITTQMRVSGKLVINGQPYVFDPPIESTPPNVVFKEGAALTIKHQVYEDAACTNVLEITDLNSDNVPEPPTLEVPGTVWYGFSLYVGGGRTYNNVQVSIANNPTLTNLAQQALATRMGAPDVNNVTIVDSNTSASETDTIPGNPPEPICVPYNINSSLPDPVVINATVTGNEATTGDPSTFVTTSDPILLTEALLPVDKDLLIDVTNPNIQISKTVVPAAAFAGETVTYTIRIQNKKPFPIFIADLWDDNVGVGQTFCDDDGLPFTPQVPKNFWSSVPECQTTSIDFTSGNWNWNGQVGVLPPAGANGFVTYSYQRPILAIDPNPLLNLAGVVGFIDADGNPLTTNDQVGVSDQTRNALTVSNSQLSVRKDATPTTTLLGSSIAYDILVTNIGTTPVYDLIVWDDRYNLEHGDPALPPAQQFLDLIPPRDPLTNLPEVRSGLQIDFFGAAPPFDVPYLSSAGTDPDLLDLGPGASILIQYNLPTPPRCVGWQGPTNEPYPTLVNSSACDQYSGLIELPLIDPFINTAYAVGLLDPDNDPSTSIPAPVYLDNVGFDIATVDLINPAIRIEKIPHTDTANIGADVDYTIRITNTGDAPLRIDEVVDVPTSNSPAGPTPLVSGRFPIAEFIFESCTGIATSSGDNALTGDKLIPLATTPGTSVSINPYNDTVGTAVLPPNCSAKAVITIQIPNPLPDNKYINVAQVNGFNLSTGLSVSDLTSASINISASGLEVNKRIWNCNTVDQDDPPTNVPDDDIGGGKNCAVQNGAAGLTPGAVQVAIQEQGRVVYYEVVITNSGTQSLSRVQIQDNQLVDTGSGLLPGSSRVPDGTVWRDATGRSWTWNNGVLDIQCDASMTGNGPFGPDKTGAGAPPGVDESCLFEPGESFARPDNPTPGAVTIPAVTYAHVVTLPQDDSYPTLGLPPDEDRTYVNRARVVGTPQNPALPQVANIATATLTIRPTTIVTTIEGCAETDGNLATPDFAPCVKVVRPGGDVWYRITLTSASNLLLQNITVTDTVRGNIPTNDLCWDKDSSGATDGLDWDSGTVGTFLARGQRAVCVYRRGAVIPALPPLQVNNDPYVNTLAVDFEIVPGAPLPNTTASAIPVSDTVRIAENELLLSITDAAGNPGCPIQAAGGDILARNIVLENIDPINPITGVFVFTPSTLPGGTSVGTLNAGAQTTLTNGLNITVDPLSVTTDYVVTAFGYLQDGVTPGGKLVTASFTCTVQRVDGNLLVTKSVINPATGGTTAAPGDTVIYTITVQNLDPLLPIFNFTLSDPMLQTLIDADPFWNAYEVPNSLPANSPPLSRSYNFTVLGNQDPVINTVTAAGLAAGITPVSSADTAQVNIATGDLVATITPSPTNPLVAGDSVVFNYEVCNTSPVLVGTTYSLFSVIDTLSGTPSLDGPPPAALPPLRNLAGTPFAPNTVTLAPQECVQYTRTYASINPTDIGTILTSAFNVDGCPIADVVTAPALSCNTPLVSDSQVRTVNIISPTGASAGLDARLTADRVGASAGDTITFTLTITNLNTVETASNITIPTSALPTGTSGAFPIIPPFDLLPLSSRSFSTSFAVPNPLGTTPDPLLAQLTIDYLMNGNPFSVTTNALSIPLASVAGSNVVVILQALPNINNALETTPGATVSYRYTVGNIGSTAITNAYLNNLNFSAAGYAGSPVQNCTATDAWGNGSAANPIPTLFGGGFFRSTVVTCQVKPDVPLTTPPTELIHTAEVDITGDVVQDTATAAPVDIVPPLAVTMALNNTGGVAMPGGPIDVRFTVTNIGDVSDLSEVTLDVTTLPECPGGWTTLTQEPTDSAGAAVQGDLWDTNPTGGLGATVPIGRSIFAIARCVLPSPFFATNDTVRDTTITFDEEVWVQVQGVDMDEAPDITIRILDPLRFTFVPPSATNFLRAGDVVQFRFQLQNVAPAGINLQNIQYVINVNGNTAPCENVTPASPIGSIAAGTTTEIVCNFRPSTTLNGTALNLTFSGTHTVNGVNVPIYVAQSPLAYSPIVEHVELQVRLFTGTAAAPIFAANVDDGTTIQFNFAVKNIGGVPLTTFTFTQNMLDANSGAAVPNKTSVLTPGRSLNDLYLFNTTAGANNASCLNKTTLLPGEECLIQGSVPSHLVSLSDLNYKLLTTDPQKFIIRVLGTAITNTGSGFTATSTGDWTGTVTRPILEIGGVGTASGSDSSGKMWRFLTSLFSYSPNPAIPNRKITFSVIIRNAGFRAFTNPTLTASISMAGTAMDGLVLTSGQPQTLPTNITFTIPVTRIDPGQAVTATGTWTSEGIRAPATVNLRLNYKSGVDSPQTFAYTNYDITSDLTPVTISTDPTAPTTDASGVPLDPNATEPIITKIASVESAFPGESVTWTITITNRNTNTMSSVTLTDSVPGDLEVVSASTSAGASVVNGNLVSITTGPLMPGQQVTVTINTNISVNASVPGIITNQACGQRQGGTQVCAEAEVALGPEGILPDTGYGRPTSSLAPAPTLVQRMPFAAAILGVFFFMLFMSMTMKDRQRLLLAGLALLVLAVLIGGVLLLGKGGEEGTGPSVLDGSPPPIGEAQIFATATPLPTDTPLPSTPTPAPTIAPEALATIQSFPPTATPYIVPTPAGPRRLDIPALSYSLPVPIVELPQVNGEWDVSNLGHNIGWLDNTTWLDPTWGNTVLVGHIQLSETDPGPFNQLYKLVPGDEIRVIEGTTITRFVVTEIFTVPPTAMEVTHPTTDPTLTLITCTDWNEARGVFSDRLVVKAVPLIEDTGS